MRRSGCNTLTDISVVIPSYNRCRALSRCLTALESQTVPPDDFEVIVVLDGSTDGSAEMLAKYSPRYILRVESKVNGGQPSASNRGVALATSPYCLFLDDDILPDSELVAGHLRTQLESGGVIAMGALRLRLVGPPGGLATHFAAWWRDHYERLGRGARVPDASACYSGNLSVPTDAFRAAGGFDESLSRSADVELAQRLVSRGLRVVYVPDAGGEQQYDKGFRDIVRDYDRAGTAALQLYHRHPELAPNLLLGGFTQGSLKTNLGRRFLLAVHAPLWPLALVDRFLRHPPASVYSQLQTYCLWRAIRRSASRDEWRRLTRGTVILMYHSLGRPGERASRYVVPGLRFRRQLAWLRRRGRRILSLDEYVSCLRENALPPAGSVVITFDDGYADTADIAVPTLRAHEASATVFLVSDAVGKANRWTDTGPLAGRPLFSWETVREARPTLTIGAHSRSHPRLTDVPSETAESEIAGSRAELEKKLGARVEHFAYPYGKWSPEIESIVRRAGFSSACSIEPGANDPTSRLFALRRLEVVGTSSLARFAVELWLGRPLKLPRGP